MNPGHAIFKRAQRLQEGGGVNNQGETAPQRRPTFWDFMNPWGGTSKGGSGTGDPTQRNVGRGVGTVTNFFFPGLGYLTGPAARWVTDKFQHGWSNKDIVAQAKQNGISGTGGSDATDVSDQPYGLSNAPPGGQDKPPPSAGVGIDPEGNPADPGEWWSPDFGRYDLGSSGQGAGNYNLAGPGGWAIGARGTGFGEHVLGNPGSAIGWETLGAPGGQANLGGSWGGVAGSQLRRIAKGLYGNDPNPEGMGALYDLTGTKSPTAGQYQQSQADLHDILQANPSLMGPTSAPMLRGGSRIPLETVQRGSSNVGLDLFRRQLKQPRKQKQ